MSMIARKSWTPILDGPEASAAWEAIESVSRALANPEPFRGPEHTLLDGRLGPALFYAYLAMATDDERVRQRSVGLLEQAIDRIADAGTDPSMMSGFIGVAWAVEHLQGRACEPAEGDLNEDIDDTILQTFRTLPIETGWPAGHELMFGLTGVGVYALERLPRPHAVEMLKQVVEILDRMSERSEEGLTWPSYSRTLPEYYRKEFPEIYHSLGVAHGVPGIIGFLGMVLAAGIERERVRGMIEEAVPWLLARRIPDARGSSFSDFHPRRDHLPSRSGWCYGNPAIATCLMIAARALGDQGLERTAHDFALEAAVRPCQDAGIVDACLCHGAAGLAHLLNRDYQATGDERLREGARFWIDHALHMRQPGQGLGGFLSYRALWDASDGAGWMSDPGFLMGASGVGLALLAAVSTVEPDWDRVLLAQVPPVAA